MYSPLPCSPLGSGLSSYLTAGLFHETFASHTKGKWGMKKAYQKPTLIRRENLVQIAASVDQNGMIVISPGASTP